MSIQKQQIVQTALDILNRDGLEGVTLRRLAKELNIKAASIYWHIANKEQLFDEMTNTILEQHFSTFDFDNDKRNWAQWIDTLAHELRAAMLTYREGARVVAGAHPDIAVMLIKIWDLSIRVLHYNGFSYGQAATITITIVNFVFGSTIEEQSLPPSNTATSRSFEGSQLTDVTYPALAQAMEAWWSQTNDVHFDTGVRIIINGVRNELNDSNRDTG